MKKIYTFLFCLLLSLSIISQTNVVFCPLGAEWNYNFRQTAGGAPQPYSYTYLEKIKYVRDTLINGNFYKVVEHKEFLNACSGYNIAQLTVIKQNGDTIFFRNAITNHTWQILYNFIAMPGQVWHTTVKGDGLNNMVTNKTTVLTKTTINVNAIALRQMTVTSEIVGSAFTNTSVITERFGSDHFMFNYNPNAGFCDAQWFERNLCYKDNEIGTNQFTSYPCNYSTVGFKEENSLDQLGLKLYPNPFNYVLHINVSANFALEAHTFKINDILGREILTERLEQNNQLDLSELNAGVYLLNVYRDNQLLTTKKMMKE